MQPKVNYPTTNFSMSSYSDFKFQNDESILIASKIVISEGLKVHRVVLRQVGLHEYVTHMENVILEGDTWKHGDFYWGHYFNKYDDASKDYFDRVKKL